MRGGANGSLYMYITFICHIAVNTLKPSQDGRHFADDTFKRIFLNENFGISIKISLKFVPQGSINNIPALIQIMAWRRPGDKPLSEPIMVRLPTHIYVTRTQWVNGMCNCYFRARVVIGNVPCSESECKYCLLVVIFLFVWIAIMFNTIIKLLNVNYYCNDNDNYDDGDEDDYGDDDK